MVAKALCIALAIICAASAAPQNRITGGSDTDITEFPHIAALVYYYPRIELYIQRCVGPLISSWHVLSSAYCFTGADLSNFVIRAGSSNSLIGGLETTMRGILKHPDYVESPRQNDIALVFLQQPFGQSSVIRPLPLPPQDYVVPDGIAGVVAGWGFEMEGGIQHDTLKSVVLEKVSLDSCAAAYADEDQIDINERVICAARESYGTCFGDAGAPMVAAVFNTPALIGISSYYKDCGSAEYPDVFTNIASYTDWIVENAVAPEQRFASDRPNIVY
ncbi:trypsin-3-like [Zerene cesonia]|uniref:trypsin-3-like n=1 Tax=Zerene cesonia TaxID=33412 RepID=UPI0018E4EC68|nr:trypsin-3-like [Zerene cesonia]